MAGAMPGRFSWVKPMDRSEALNRFLEILDLEEVTGPHRPETSGKITSSYFKTFRDQWSILDQPFTIVEFLKKIEPVRVMLVHYSGTEDSTYYNEPILPVPVTTCQFISHLCTLCDYGYRQSKRGNLRFLHSIPLGIHGHYPEDNHQ